MFEPLCKTTGAPDALSFFTGSISILLMIINIPGNLLVILAVALDPNKNLRNSFNFLVTNLAVADLIVGLVTDPLSIHVHFKEGRNQAISDAEIKAIHLSYFISCTASVLSIILLACDRYIALVHPTRHRQIMSRCSLIISIIVIWILAIGLPCIYLEVGYVRYAFIFANTAVLIAIIVTIFTYTRLILKFHKASRPSTSTTDSDITLGSPTALTLPTHNDQRRITEMFFVILIAVLCCYVPSTVLIYAMNFCESCSCDEIHTFRDLQFVFVIANSSVNFFCYAFRSPRFRSAFKVILRLQKASSESDDVNMNTVEKGETEVTDNKL